MGTGVAKRAVRTMSALVNRVLVIALCFPFAMGCYALWDSHTVFEHAEATQWQPYKPKEPEPLSFWELQRINPEVRAWLSVYGTNIDYPVCKAAANNRDKYLTTDAKGDYALSGALFVDEANAPDFSDYATIVYGHHMQSDVMFGPLTNFCDKDFFDEHRYGNLFVNNVNHGLEFFGYLDVDAYDTSVYRPVLATSKNKQDYLSALRQKARHWRNSIAIGPNNPIVLLSTCAPGNTNARGVLVGNLCDQVFKNPFVKIPNLGTGVDLPSGPLGIPVWCWVCLVAFATLTTTLVVTQRGHAHA